MIYLIFGLVFLAVFLMAGRALTRIPAAQIAQHARFGGVAFLGLLALMLMLTGRFGAMSGVLALAGRAMANNSRFGKPAGFDDVTGTFGERSNNDPSIRTRYLEMQLDKSVGSVDGRFIDGPFKGRPLNALPQDQLVQALATMRDDPESIRLLEAYLDRTFSGWREHHNQRSGGRDTGATDAGGMGENEAYEILGLEPGADADAIRAAHRRLMATIHPDRGGTTYLATQVNPAKEILLKLHG